MKKVYVVIYFTRLGKAVCLDRGYNFISDNKEEWECIKLGDIIQSDRAFFAGQDIPNWAIEADENGIGHIAFWTNYYE